MVQGRRIRIIDLKFYKDDGVKLDILILCCDVIHCGSLEKALDGGVR